MATEDKELKLIGLGALLNELELKIGILRDSVGDVVQDELKDVEVRRAMEEAGDGGLSHLDVPNSTTPEVLESLSLFSLAVMGAPDENELKEVARYCGSLCHRLIQERQMMENQAVILKQIISEIKAAALKATIPRINLRRQSA